MEEGENKGIQAKMTIQNQSGSNTASTPIDHKAEIRINHTITKNISDMINMNRIFIQIIKAKGSTKVMVKVPVKTIEIDRNLTQGMNRAVTSTAQIFRIEDISKGKSFMSF